MRLAGKPSFAVLMLVAVCTVFRPLLAGADATRKANQSLSVSEERLFLLADSYKSFAGAETFWTDLVHFNS